MDLSNIHFMYLNDTFTFTCTHCGACCRNREDILLNGYDIWKMGHFLDKTQLKIIEEYAEVYIGNDSKLPLVRLLPRGKNKICPFLSYGKCKIHEVKPAVCALYPLGRVYSENTDEPKYILQDVKCGSNKTYTVNEWLIHSGIGEQSNKCAKLWGQLLMDLYPFVHGIQQFSSETKDMIYNALIYKMYLDYRYNGDFHAQLVERTMELEQICKKFNILYKKYYGN